MPKQNSLIILSESDGDLFQPQHQGILHSWREDSEQIVAQAQMHIGAHTPLEFIKDNYFLFISCMAHVLSF